MDRTHTLLENLCADIERQLKPKLNGDIGMLVARYLPQVWVFETEYGACTLILDSEGNASVLPGADPARDVTIQWKRDSLLAVLESRTHDSVSPGDYPAVLVHTDRGRVAFNYLKKEVGL